MLILIAIVCLVYVLAGVLIWRRGRVWINPITFVLVYYFFNYPVRAALVVYFPDVYNRRAFDSQEIAYALIYSALYVAIFVSVYLALVRSLRISFPCPPLVQCELDIRLLFVAVSLVLGAGAIVVGYDVREGLAFSLGQDIEELRRPLLINAVGVFYSIKWFALCLGVLVSIRTRKPSAVVVSLLVLVMIVSEAMFSTSKGLIAAFLVLFMFIDNFLTGRVIRIYVVLSAIVGLVLFSANSYYSRYYIGFGGEREGAFGELINYLTAADIYDKVLEQLETIVDRGTYYLDAIALMIRDGVAVAPGPYAFGSAVEVLNIIPRATGLMPEQYSFDRHVAEAVWGSWAFGQIFIGRIGESFFVLGEWGLIYAAINAAIFALVARMWAKSSGSLAGIALYFALLVSWLYADVSLFYQSKLLVYISFAYCVTKWLTRYTETAGRRRHSVVRHP